MKNPFRRRKRRVVVDSTWPADKERRRPENADLRAALELAHRADVRSQAAQNALQTEKTSNELDSLEAQVRLLRLKAGDL